MDRILEVLSAKGVKVEDLQSELEAAYNEEVAGLKRKNSELILKMKRRGDESESPSKLYELEDALSSTKAEAEALKARYERELKKAQAAAAELAAKFEATDQARKSLVKDQALAEALGRAKITDPVMSKAARALLASGVDVVDDGGTLKTVYKTEKGAVDVSAFIETWAQGDEGKRFVSAPVNSGSGASGGSDKGSGARQIARTEYDKMSAAEKHKFVIDGGKVE